MTQCAHSDNKTRRILMHNPNRGVEVWTRAHTLHSRTVDCSVTITIRIIELQYQMKPIELQNSPLNKLHAKNPPKRRVSRA